MVFRVGFRDPCTRDVVRFSESVKDRATSQVHGSCYPARKTIQLLFYIITIIKQQVNNIEVIDQVRNSPKVRHSDFVCVRSLR